MDDHSVMPAYYGEMQPKGHTTRMPATVTISGGKLRLSSGTNDLGEWPLNRVGIEEYTDKSVLLAAEDEELIVFFEKHAEFVKDNERYMRQPEGSNRRLNHPAFQKENDGPSLSEEIRDGLSREVTPIVAEAQHLIGMIEPGPPLWIAGIAFFLAVVFLPGLVIGIGLIVGVVALLAGGLGYADDKIAVRIPGPFTPAMLVMIGTVLLLLAIFVGIAFT